MKQNWPPIIGWDKNWENHRNMNEILIVGIYVSEKIEYEAMRVSGKDGGKKSPINRQFFESFIFYFNLSIFKLFILNLSLFEIYIIILFLTTFHIYLINSILKHYYHFTLIFYLFNLLI